MNTQETVQTAALLAQIGLQLAMQLQKVMSMMAEAHANGGTGLSDAQLNELFGEDDAAKDRAKAVIAAAQAQAPQG